MKGGPIARTEIRTVPLRLGAIGWGTHAITRVSEGARVNRVESGAQSRRPFSH